MSDAVDLATAARQRAMILTELRFFLQDKYLRRGGRAAERMLVIDGVRVPPRADVVGAIVGELLVGSTLAKRHADSILSTGVELNGEHFPELFEG